nr:unnamed protein product [Digitaria exilis]
MSRTAWVAAGLVARLLMLAVLGIAMQLRFSNKAHFDFVGAGYNNDLQSYTLLQIPIALYLLCRSKRTTPSALALDVSTYADIVVTMVLASGVGAGFGASVDLVEYIKHAGSRWDDDANHDLIRYYNKGNIAIVFLFAGMVLSLCSTVGSVRLRVRASNGIDGF